MLFKIAAVPFHFWAPDVYEGSPALTTATMSTLAKVVAMATLYKLLSAMNAEISYSFQIIIVVISIASMTVGNIMALRQANVKRMLAFSGISHAGFMLMTLLSLSSSASSLLYYASAYTLSGIAAFSVLLYVCKNIGFIAIKKKYPNDYKDITFVFNDIDTLPALKNTFNFITTKGTVKHFYGFTYALGGIFSITGGDFEKCNGFPNNWGWGLEDNAMHDRTLLYELKIDRSQFVPLNSKLVIHLYDHPNRIINNKEPGNYLHKNLRDNLNNINELNYEIVRNSVSDTPMDSETSTKISSIEQNEYMINILHFRTLVNPANELFYTQNTFYNGKLKPDQIENEIRRNRWSLKF